MKRLFWFTLLATLPAPAHLSAQTAPAVPLERFIAEVAQLWSEADVQRLVALIPPGDQLLLDTGAGSEVSSGRHAAAALRDLFGDRQTSAAWPTQVTLAGSDPLRGFGELSWVYRDRGAPGLQSRSVYVATISDGNAWKITELRLVR